MASRQIFLEVPKLSMLFSFVRRNFFEQLSSELNYMQILWTVMYVEIDGSGWLLFTTVYTAV